MWDEDEPKNAECAREMLVRGDWVVPTFNEQLRYDKPALLYWLMISAYKTFGVNEFAARFWSALLAVGTSLATYHLGRILFRPQVGLWAGLAMASCLMFVVAGRAATPDSSLIFCTTLTMLAFVRATWGANPTLVGANRLSDFLPKSWFGWVTVYTAMGFGVLAKGPVAIALPGSVIALYLLCARYAAEQAARPRAGFLAGLAQRFSPPAVWRVFWSMRPLTALAVVGAVALPWYVLVGVRTGGDWPAGFLGTHNVGRFLKPMEGHHGPIVYYLPAIIIGFFPWSMFMLPSVIELVQRIRTRSDWASYVFVACWAGFYLAFFSFARTKLPSYVLPCYPALALMTAVFIDHWLTSPHAVSRWMLAGALSGTAAVGIGFMAAFPIAAPYVLPGEGAIGLVGVSLLIGGSLALAWAHTNRPRYAAVAFGVMAVAFVVSLFGVAATRVSRHQNSEPLIALIRQVDPAPVQLATFDYNAPSLVFYAQQRVAQYYAEHEAKQFFASQGHAYMITRAECLAGLKAVLPADVQEIARQPRFLRHGKELVLLGRPPKLARSTQHGAR